jgi:hypothetical protein
LVPVTQPQRNREDPQVSTNSDFGTFGRFRETPVDQIAPEMKAA